MARALKPAMLIRGVIDYKLDEHLHAALVSGVEELLKVLERAVARVNICVIGDVVAVVSQWRRIKWEQPDTGDAEILKIVELVDQAAEIADAVIVAIGKGFHMDLVNYCILVPERIGCTPYFPHVRASLFRSCKLGCSLRGNRLPYEYALSRMYREGCVFRHAEVMRGCSLHRRPDERIAASVHKSAGAAPARRLR